MVLHRGHAKPLFGRSATRHTTPGDRVRSWISPVTTRQRANGFYMEGKRGTQTSEGRPAPRQSGKYYCASAFLIWPLPRSSPSRRVAMWSKFHLYWTGMNRSGNTGRTRACHRRAYSNLDAWAAIRRSGRCCSCSSAGRTARDPETIDPR
jgi:hypothetical protein